MQTKNILTLDKVDDGEEIYDDSDIFEGEYQEDVEDDIPDPDCEWKNTHNQFRYLL